MIVIKNSSRTPRVSATKIISIVIVAMLIDLSVSACNAQDSAKPETHSTFKGKYVLARNLAPYPMCVPFTQNLNETRQLDFDVCDPRLSEKYPRFTRPDWEEIPLDLAVAEKITKGILPVIAPEKAEPVWRRWLKNTEQLRLEGKVKMWRLHVDIDRDGKLETIIRVNDGLPSHGFGRNEGCRYRDDYLYMIEGDSELAKNFNFLGSFGDLIRDIETGRFFLIEWSTLPTAGSGIWGRGVPTFIPNATRGVAVYEIKPTHGPIAVCNVQWVPSASHTPANK